MDPKTKQAAAATHKSWLESEATYFDRNALSLLLIFHHPSHA